MATGGPDRHPSYNNRYKTSSNGKDYTPHRSQRLSSISETLEHEEMFGRLSFSDPQTPIKTTSQLSRMVSNESCHSDDVFVDCGQVNELYLGSKLTIDKTFSSASTASILPNPYNKKNHKFHGMFWCACCFYFVFFCCMPAVGYMELSDKEYRKGNEFKAMRYGKTASACFILGAVLSVIIYGSILFLVIYFSRYLST